MNVQRNLLTTDLKFAAQRSVEEEGVGGARLQLQGRLDVERRPRVVLTPQKVLAQQQLRLRLENKFGVTFEKL